MTFQEYPKALYLRGWEDLDAVVTVHDRAEEDEARTEGYRTLLEPVAEPTGYGDAAEAPKRRGRPPKAVEA